ncbi:hypothetical protein D3C78_1869040 [compost metagenome]
MQATAGQFNMHLFRQQFLLNAHRHGGAGTTATGLRFTGTALINPQFDVLTAHHLHKADVGAFREAIVPFQYRPQ